MLILSCSEKSFIYVIIFIFAVTVFSLIMKPNTNEELLYNGNYHIKIYKNKITLYKYNKKLDIHRLENRVYDYELGDIDGDGRIELVVLTKKAFRKYGKEVYIFKIDKKIEEIYSEDFSRLKPWTIALGDVDGDGKDEVSVGVYKKTQFHRVMAKRPFIYSFEDNRLVPKWKGSRLSKPFTDYIFYDIDENGIDEIVSIEILENEEKVINTYKWKGFGFEGFLQSNSFKDLQDLKKVEDKIYVKFKKSKKPCLGEVNLYNGNIIIEEVKEN